jgi:hypothetical protein
MALFSSTKASPTQEFVPIDEVRDGIVILKDGSLRGIFMASSLNIALKSEQEQEAILFQFQNFLNSLDFSVQIFVQSRELDIRPYVTLLEGRLVEQTNDLMKIQVREYIDFVKSLTEGTNIMTKSFFIVIPYSPPILAGKNGIVSGVTSMIGASGKQSAEQKNATFEENRSQLEQRLAIVEQGLSRTGVRLAQLSTEEVIELFYKIFNIGELERPIPLQNTPQR